MELLSHAALTLQGEEIIVLRIIPFLQVPQPFFLGFGDIFGLIFWRVGGIFGLFFFFQGKRDGSA